MVLAACGVDGDTSYRRIAPWTYRIGCLDDIDVCYDEADRLCPVGFHVQGEGERTTGAVAQTNMVGNTAMTTIRTKSRGAILVECIRPTICTTQEQCAPAGLRCVMWPRLPGRAICRR
jgi:hypothetical protein